MRIIYTYNDNCKEGNTVTFKQIEKIIKADGWYRLKITSGSSHRQYKHPTKPGKVTIAYHAKAIIPLGTINNILKQAGLK
jgi:predicted RNA binding protein YcfA (HicA-like mRNA interferase family)